ncbi:MAG: DUF1573 domain-containing protein [Chloroflexi bacterium]|nr:DUF1573 domain-containing protein [Chloroflexota bacterium]
MSQNSRKSRRTGPPRRQNNSLLWVLIVAGGALALVLFGYLVWAMATGGAAGSAAQVTPEVTGAPKLKADRGEINLGDVKLGQTVQAEFILTNVGDQPLQVTEKPYIEVLEGC